MDAWARAYEDRTKNKPIIGGREGGAIKRMRQGFKANRKTDDDLIAWIIAFYRDDWRADSTSIVQIAADPNRYLVVQQRFRRELGAGMQPADDNMQTRYYKDEDFK
jgi:hypothetical protein